MSLDTALLPTLNAWLNALVLTLLLRGYWHMGVMTFEQPT